MTSVGLPLIVGGLFVNGEGNDFRNLRNDYMSRFNCHIDDYIRYSPAIVMLGLKALGVEGRSSWNRMLVSDALSTVLMGGVVRALDLKTRVMRPDGTDRSSFPSGHTAIAFMTATMLNKEYGDKSPWVGIGAYSVATATGLLRMANNKHWLRDVMVGAGIGIMSTECGYYIADALFKDKGINKKNNIKEYIDKWKSPSFISLYTGFNIPLSRYNLSRSVDFKTSSGAAAGIEGAYFINPYIGFGGRFTISNTNIKLNTIDNGINTFDAISYGGGAYFSYPLTSHWQVGAKMLINYIHYPQIKLIDTTIPKDNGVGVGTGTYVTFVPKAHFGLRLHLDYNLLPPYNCQDKAYFNMLSVAASYVLMF
jgi:hypothetical protein